MQLFSADPTIVLNFLKMFVLTNKSWKNHPQKLLRKPQIHFFSLMPWLPKRPKQKNSCSKMWLIDQLYIELGLQTKETQTQYFFISRILWNILLKIHEIIDKVGQYVCSWQSPKLERGQFLSPYFSWYLTFLWDFLACWYISQTPL